MKKIYFFLKFVVYCLVINLAFHFKKSNGFTFPFFKCSLYECCADFFLNYTKLEENLDINLYGQPLVKNTLLKSIKSHFSFKDNDKALVLSFHGPSGVGKTFVSQFIAESIFYSGSSSNFYKKYIANNDFPDPNKIGEYKEQIKNDIESRVKKCPYSLFIFDETDKLPTGLTDVLKAYMDHNKDVNGIDYRKSIFIFLSNIGAKLINKQVLELDKQNVKRESYDLNQFHLLIQNHAFNEKENQDKKGLEGLYQATIIDHFLVDHFIPFLPLERSHVRKCIVKQLKQNSFANRDSYQISHMEEDIDDILKKLVFEPPGLLKFSSTGCKRVKNLVNNLIIEKRRKEL